MPHEVIDLARAEIAAEGLAEIGQRPRVAEQMLQAGAVGAGEPAGGRRREEGTLGHEPRQEPLEIRAGDVAAGQGGGSGPGRLQAGQVRPQPVEGVLGEPAIGRDLAPEHGEDRRTVGVEFEYVIAGDRRGVRRRVVIVEGSEPRKAPDHVVRADLPLERAVDAGAEIACLLG
ncbi:hypothetical protein M2437_001639 [Methylorubrum pseudosasae]|nr:hypothetical protein [Methylorubrum pseudosasae]